MPRPLVLPAIDWPAIFESGLDYEGWLAIAEKPESLERLKAQYDSIALAPEAREFLARLSRPVHVVAIAEAWCGDVLRHVPVLQALIDAASQLKVRYIGREQHPDVLVRFLTNGGEAIPKFIFLNDRFIECGNWGPMPEEPREVIARGKACGDLLAARRRVSELYAADPDCRDVIRELLHLIDIASSASP